MIKQEDLKIGMYLSNDGPGVINIYDSNDATGTPELVIKPKEMIGQIVDFHNGPDGFVVYFKSDAISSSAPFTERACQYLVPTNWGSYLVGSAKFSEVQANVNESQVQVQSNAIATAAANGVSISNAIKKVTTGISESIENAIPWNLVWFAGGTYVVLNWNKFFKPTNLRK